MSEQIPEEPDTQGETVTPEEPVANDSPEHASQEPMREGRVRPVVWTPEDASRFLSTAIKEAQQPLVEALRRPSVPRSTFVLSLIAILTLVGVAGWIQYRHVSFIESSNDALTKKATQGEEAQIASMAQKEELEKLHTKTAQLEKALESEKIKRIQSEEKAAHALREVRGDAQRSRIALAENEAEVNRLREALKKAIQGKEELLSLRKRSRLQQVQLEGQEDQIVALQKQLQATKELLGNTPSSADATAVVEEAPEPKPVVMDKPVIVPVAPPQKLPALTAKEILQNHILEQKKTAGQSDTIIKGTNPAENAEGSAAPEDTPAVPDEEATAVEETESTVAPEEPSEDESQESSSVEENESATSSSSSVGLTM